MFDVFVSRLQCPRCNAAVDAEIQTHIRNGAADGSALGVGFEFDPIDLTHESIVNTGYALVRPAGAAGPIRLLDVWICPSCETEQWAVVEIANRTIRVIRAVTLDRGTLDSVNYISDVNADLLAKALDGEASGRGESSVEILRRRLP
jgi:hypothetical protein